MQHLAAVMDGNRRWAQQRGKTALEGHTKGVDAARAVVAFCLKHKIPYLSLYTFSLENFRRSAEEKNHLFSLIALQAENDLNEFIEKEMHIRFVGDREQFPADVRKICDRIEERTKQFTRLRVNFLFCYGGQQEIVAASQELARKVAAGHLAAKDISVDVFNKHLWLGDVPPPDVIIRTGDVRRLSNFLLFQAAYSELYFSDVLWPDVTETFLEQVMSDFNNIKRNFGK